MGGPRAGPDAGQQIKNTAPARKLTPIHHLSSTIALSPDGLWYPGYGNYVTEKLLRFFAVLSYHALSPAAYYELQSNRCEFGSPRLTERCDTHVFRVRRLASQQN